MSSPVSFPVRRALLSAAVLFGGCASQVQRLEPQLGTPRLSIAAPAPEATTLLACFGRRLARYVDLSANGVPPVVVEVVAFPNRNPSPLQRQELPNDGTTMLKSLLASVGPAVAYRDPRDAGSRTGEPPALLRLTGEIQVVEASPVVAAKGFDLSVFFGNADASARDGSQASLASITLDMSAVDSRGYGTYSMSAPVRVVFERSFTRERSVAASFSSVAAGINDSLRTVHGYGHALRLAMAIQVTTILSRATRVPAGDCLRAVAAEGFDTLPLQAAVNKYREVMAQDAEAGAFWLNKLRALHGRHVSAPFALESEPASSSDELVAIPDDSDLAKFVAAQALSDVPLAEHEREFAMLWSTLPDVSAENFQQGSRWIDRVEAQLAAARAAEAAKVKAKTPRKSAPVVPQKQPDRPAVNSPAGAKPR